MFWKLQENILEKNDIELLVDFIKTTDRFTQFTKVREFEAAWSAWQGCKYSTYVNSGSSANLVMINLAKQIHGWADGDEILVPAVTWITNIAPIIQCGLKPVFIDVNLDDFSFDYEGIKEKITDKTRAIFITHLLGFPADIKKIEKIVAGTDIVLLEDCCESHGANINGTKVGNFGEASSFSFYWGHHMTTVEGGMVCTNDPEIWKSAVLKRSHGLARELPPEFHDNHRVRHPDVDFNFLFLTDGFNVRNTELHAVLGIAQLRHLDSYIATRTKNHERFLEITEPYKNYIRRPYKAGVSSFCLPFLFEDTQLKQKFQKRIAAAGIESRPIVSGNLLRQPFLKDYKGTGNFKNAEFLHTNGFYVGNNQFVNEERLGKLESLLAQFFTEELG